MKRQTLMCAAALLAVAAGCGSKKGEGTEETAVAGPASLRDVISQTGEVQPVVKVDLKCEASGTIEKIFIKEGQPLAKGDKILIIDPTRLRTSKEKLDLQVEQAAIQREQAQRAYKRGQELSATGSVSQKQLEDLKSQLDLADITYRQRVLDRKDVAEQLAKTTVVAPMTGIMTSLDVDEGEIAQSATSGMQAGTTIGTIADISNLEVITQIGEADYTKLRKGQSVVITPEAVEGAHTRGTISFISLAAKKKGSDELGTFEVRISVDSIIPGIVPGVNVHVEFVVLEKQVDLAVPYHYVEKKNGAYTVQVRRGCAASGRRGPPPGDARSEGAPPQFAQGAAGGDSARAAHIRRGDGSGQGRPGARRGAGGKGGAKARKPGKARSIEIQVGDTDYRSYEVVSGLSAGDTVVYTPPRAEGENDARTQRGPGGPGGGGRR